MPSTNSTVVWIYSGILAGALDKATWLQTATELGEYGWNTVLISAGPRPAEGAPAMRFVQLEWPNVYVIGYLFFHFAAAWYLLSDWPRIDVVLFHTPAAPFLFPLSLLRRAFGRRFPRFVFDLRTVPMSTSTTKARLQSSFFWTSTNLARFWVDGVTAITSRLAEAVGVPKTKLLGTWPSGVSLGMFEQARSSRVARRCFEPLRLIYVGALSEERHILELCQAVVRAKEAGCSVALTVVGDGTQMYALTTFAANQVNGTIDVRPAVPHQLVPGLLAEADVGVLPFPNEPQYRVSSPIKLFEYLAAGLPILATRVVCHTDVLNKKPCVFWADDGSVTALTSAIQRIWAQRADLAEMSRVASVTARDWTWRHSAQRLAKALTAACA